MESFLLNVRISFKKIQSIKISLFRYLENFILVISNSSFSLLFSWIKMIWKLLQQNLNYFWISVQFSTECQLQIRLWPLMKQTRLESCAFFPCSSFKIFRLRRYATNLLLWKIRKFISKNLKLYLKVKIFQEKSIKTDQSFTLPLGIFTKSNTFW